MGLRIVDKKRYQNIELTEPERLGMLSATAEAFATSLSDQAALSASSENEPAKTGTTETFWARYRRAHATMSPPGVAADAQNASAFAVTGRVCESILGRSPASALSHTKVEIATLLKLL